MANMSLTFNTTLGVAPNQCYHPSHLSVSSSNHSSREKKMVSVPEKAKFKNPVSQQTKKQPTVIKIKPKTTPQKKRKKYENTRNFFKLRNMMIVSFLFLNLRQMMAKSLSIKGEHGVYTYNPENLIGSGSFGKVYKGFNSKNEEVAIKKIKNNDLENSQELDILRKLGNHDYPNIISFKDVIYQKEWEWIDKTYYIQRVKYTYIITQYCSGGDLLDYIKNVGLDKETAKKVFKEMIKAVTVMHDNDMVHRDLKPENFILELKDDNNEKAIIPILIDFGISFDLETTKMGKDHPGTLPYRPPEARSFYDIASRENKRKDRKKIAKATDVWSLGVILYVLLTGNQFPESAMTFICKKKDWLPENLEKFFQEKDWSNGKIDDEKARNLIEKMMKFKPEERIQLDAILKDPWFDDSTPTDPDFE